MKLTALVAAMALASTAAFADPATSNPPTIPGPVGIDAFQATSQANQYNLFNIVNRVQDNVAPVGGPLSPDWSKYITVSGIIQADANTSSSVGDYTNSSLYLRNAELYFDAQVNDWLSGHVTVAYGQDPNNANNYANPVNTSGAANEGNGNGVQPFTLYAEEAAITLANTDKSPVWLTAGRQMFPFGSTMRNTISGSLVSFLTYTLDNGVTTGYISPVGVHAELFAGQGPQPANTAATTIRTWGGNVGYGQTTNPLLQYNVDVGFINNLYENYFIQNNAQQFTQGGSTNADPVYHRQTPGVDVHFDVTSGPFGFIADYATATRHFEASDLPSGTSTTQGALPWAYFTEASYKFDVMNYSTEAAIGYQQSGDAVNIQNDFALGGYAMPQYRYVVSYGVDVTKTLNVKVEYRHDIDYKVSDGGAGGSDNVALGQLQLLF